MANTKKKKTSTNTAKKSNKKAEHKLSKTASASILLALIVLFGFSLLKIGAVGILLNNLLSLLFSGYYFVLLLTFLYFLIRVIIQKKEDAFSTQIYIGIIILNLAVMMYCSLINATTFKDIMSNLPKLLSNEAKFGGGLIGTSLYTLFTLMFSDLGSNIVLILLFIISVLLIGTDALFSLVGHGTKSAFAYIYEAIESFLDESYDKKKAKIQEEKNKQKAIQSKKDSETIAAINSSSAFINLQEGEDLHIDLPPVEPEPIDDGFEVFEFSPVKDNTEPAEEINIQTSIINESGEISGDLTNPNAPKVLHRENPFVDYKLPNAKSLLMAPSSSKSNKNQATAEARGRKLIEILANFGVPATLLEYHIGPSVTKFEIKPDPRVQLSKINSLSDNIKMELAAKDIRIEAPIPGKNAVGVEVPNAENMMVRMSELITKVPVKDKDQKLLFALGKDLSGYPTFCRLDKMPHLLIAGSTGSGKSVCINTIITSFLLRTKPDEVKLVMVDPKKVEFTPYHDIPHLLWPVITDAKMAALMLKKVVAIMDDRYNLFAAAGAREINSYNEKVIEHNKNLKEGEEAMNKLPYIVVIIDELADLMQVASKDVEGSIQRITQLARASGIHLIVATQRPSTDVITGLIKSNMPSRISFAVSSSIDSRTILDQTGAEKLLGNGDMLYSPQGENAPIRLQGCYVNDDEIIKITDYVKSQAKPDYDDTYFAIQNNGEGSSSSEGSADKEDDLYQECVSFVAKTKKASTSLLQRRFGIGYNRAARIIDAMEENGLIGPAQGSKPREVYIRDASKE